MFEKFRNWVSFHRKIIIIGFVVLIVASLAGGLYLFVIKNRLVSRTDPAGSGQAAEPEIKVKPSPLTGIDVSKDLAARPVTGVMIENSPEARPQSGLADAGVVFEAIAEGGITRFLALYQEDQPDLIGPVRSLRPYYLDWARGFNSSVAHVGGSEEALRLARSVEGFRDLDQFSNGAYFFRSKDRFAPHNVYTRTSLLDLASAKKNFGESEFVSIARRKPKPAETPTATTVTIDYSSPLFKASYVYDKPTNTYKRSQANKPHVDRETNKQLYADSVVVMKINWSVQPDGHSVYGTTQGGEVLIFQDGLVTKGSWSKASRSDQVKFTDGAGVELKLIPGRTWISAVPNSRTVTYQ